jgi:hypothetical protein
MGCRTIGIAGGPTKTKLCLDEFGYDVAIDYKAARSIDEQLADACPDGVDVLFRQYLGADQRRRDGSSVGRRSGGDLPAPLRSQAGTRRRSVRASSVIFWSSARGCPAFSSSITNTATWRRSNVSPNGSAKGSSVTAKRFPTALNIARQPSPSFIGEKISARD